MNAKRCRKQFETSCWSSTPTAPSIEYRRFMNKNKMVVIVWGDEGEERWECERLEFDERDGCGVARLVPSGKEFSMEDLVQVEVTVE